MFNRSYIWHFELFAIWYKVPKKNLPLPIVAISRDSFMFVFRVVE